MAGGRHTGADNGEGRLYIAELAEAIEKADRIVVTEHSIDDDILDVETQQQRPASYVPVIYVTKELTPTQRANFLDSVRSMPPKTQDAFTACIFEPHHTITFYHAGKPTSAINVCFQCGDIQWDGSRKTQPWSLVPTLGKLITSLGMQEERDWRALAQKK